MKTTETNYKKPQRNRIYRSETGYSTADMQKTTAEWDPTTAKCHLRQRNVKNRSEMPLNLVKSLSAAVWSFPPWFGAFRSDLRHVSTVSFIRSCVEPPLNKEFPNTCR